MKPPEPCVIFRDSYFIGTAVARDGNVMIDGNVCSVEEIRMITQHLKFLANAAQAQRDYQEGRD